MAEASEIAATLSAELRVALTGPLNFGNTPLTMGNAEKLWSLGLLTVQDRRPGMKHRNWQRTELGDEVVALLRGSLKESGDD